MRRSEAAWLPAMLGWAIAASLVVTALLMAAAGLHVRPFVPENIGYYAAAVILGAIRFAPLSREWRGGALCEAVEYYALFAIIALAGTVATYPIATLTHGYHDAELQRIDSLIGFDWPAWYRTVAAHPLLQETGLAAYRSVFVTPAVLLGYFAWTGERGRAYRLLAAFWLAAAITLAAFALMPAIGPFSFLWHGAIPYMPESETWQAGLIPALRAHAVTEINLAHLRGLVSAPSFHAAAAVLFIAASWSAAPLRAPLIALNLAMLLATPVEGTHYLIDMILGAAVAAAALVAVRALSSGDQSSRKPMPIPARAFSSSVDTTG